MKNTAINTIKYTGIVTLSQYIGSKKIKLAQLHNEGGNALFDFLASCLVGDFTKARLTRPTKVILLERDADTKVLQQPTGSTGFIYLLAKPEKIYDSPVSRVRYSFIIPKEVIDSISDVSNLWLGLYTDEATLDADKLQNYAALCELNISKNNVINASLAVDWELVISNIDTVE